MDNFSSMSSSSEVSSFITTRQNVVDHLAGNGETVGAIVFWNLFSAEFDLTNLTQLWDAAGLNKEDLPKAQTPEKALHAAVRAAGRGEGHRLLRKISDTSEAVIFGVVNENADASAVSLDYSHKSTITLKKSTGQLLLSDRDDKLALEVEKTFNHYISFNPAKDLMTAITKTLKRCSAISLRETGGFYWIPAQFLPKVRALKDVVGKIGQSIFSILSVGNNPETLAELRGAAANTLDAELEKLVQDLDSCEQEGFYAKPLLERASVFNEIADRAELYKTLLGLQTESIETKVNGLRDRMHQMVAEKEAEQLAKKEAAKAAKKAEKSN